MREVIYGQDGKIDREATLKFLEWQIKSGAIPKIDPKRVGVTYNEDGSVTINLYE